MSMRRSSAAEPAVKSAGIPPAAALAAAESVQAFVDFACRSPEGHLILIGWARDRQGVSSDFCLMRTHEPSSAGARPSITPIDEKADATAVVRFPRPDVAQAMSEQQHAESNRYGFLLAVPDAPADADLALALPGGQYTRVPFSVLGNTSDLKRVLRGYWRYCAMHAGPLIEALGDDHALSRICAELADEASALGSAPVDSALAAAKAPRGEATSETQFFVECGLQLNSGAVFIGWVVSRAAELKIEFRADTDSRARTRFETGRAGKKLVRTLRPDLKAVLQPHEFADGMHGFVFYWPMTSTLPTSVVIDFNGSDGAAREVVLLPPGEPALQVLLPLWLHAGQALHTLGVKLRDEAAFLRLLQDVEEARAAEFGLPFAACDDAILLNGRALLLNGWIARRTEDIRRVELLTGEDRADITVRLSRYVRPDLYEAHPWSQEAALGMLAVVTERPLEGCDVRVVVETRQGERQVMRPRLRMMDWPMFAQFIYNNPRLDRRLLVALEETSGLEPDAERLADRIAWLRRGSFLSRYPKLPANVDKPATLIGAVEQAYPLGPAGVVIIGWQVNPRREPGLVRLRAPEGDSPDLRAQLLPVLRADVASNLRPHFHDISDWCGFVCVAAMPTAQGEPRALCFDFGELGEEWLKVPTSGELLPAERLAEQLLRQLPSTQYRETLLQIGRALGEEAAFRAAIEEDQSERVNREKDLVHLVCEHAWLVNGRTLILHGWIGIEQAELERCEFVVGEAVLDLKPRLRRTMRTDLAERFPWTREAPAGFVAVVDGHALDRGSLKLRVAARDGQRYLVRVFPSGTDWSGLQEFLVAYSQLIDPVLRLLDGVRGSEAGAARLAEHIELVRRSSFLARYPSLAQVSRQAETLTGAVDFAFPLGQHGLVVFGWHIYFKRAPTAIRLVTPQAGSEDLSDRFVALPRLDVSDGLRDQYPGISDDCGFVVHVPTATRPGEMRGLAFDFGDFGTVVLKVPTPDPILSDARLIERILSTVPGADRIRLRVRELFDRALGEPLQALARETPRTVLAEHRFGSMPAKPLASLIVPVGQSPDLVRQQLAYFARDPEFAGVDLMYVVDEPRATATVLEIGAKYQELFGVPFRVLAAPTAIAKAAAINAAAALAKAEYLAVFGPDLIPETAGWVSLLTRALDTIPSAGAVAPLLRFLDGAVRSSGCTLRTEDSLPGFLLTEDSGRGTAPPAGPRRERSQAVSLRCFMTRTSDFRAAGGLAGAYQRDRFVAADFCFALERAGKQAWVEQAARLWCLAPEDESFFHIGARQLVALFDAWLFTRKAESAGLPAEGRA